MWFEKLTGFKEGKVEELRNNLSVSQGKLICSANGKEYQIGNLEIPKLETLRKRISFSDFKGQIEVSEKVGDVKAMHRLPDNANSVFQAASQFNLLEMTSPRITPEFGITDYAYDKTQGPACAIACGAGTVYRNYFVKLENGQIGQSKFHQIDCLSEIGKELKNDGLSLWEMSNGYAMVNQNGLLHINKKLHSLRNEGWESLKGKLKVGIQWNTEVTITDDKQCVTQVYCSALQIGYSELEWIYWEKFARLILESTYESTFYSAVENFINTGNNKLFLTLVGGGVFGNQIEWILDAIEISAKKFRNVPLDVQIVSYGGSHPEIVKLVENLKKNSR